MSHAPKLRLVEGEMPPGMAHELQVDGPPDFAGETAAQVREAMDLLGEDTSQCPRVPWPDLDALLGPMRAWNWWTIAAHFKQGKTTILMSLVAHWLEQGRPVYILPLETGPDVMRATLASLRTGLDTARVLAGRWDELPQDAVHRIAADMSWQMGPEGRELLYFNRQAEVGEKDLEVIMCEAAIFGAEVVIIDHIHELDTGPGNPWNGFKRLCSAINGQAKDKRIPILTAAQMHRGDRDRLARHQPPNPMSLQFGDVLGQKTHVLLGAFRPLKGKLSKSDELEARKGEGGIKRFLEPNCVGFHVMAHRLNGAVADGRVVKLRYEHGRIVDPTPSQRMLWEQ